MSANPSPVERYSPPPGAQRVNAASDEQLQPSQNPLMSATSVVDQLRDHVKNLTVVTTADLPEWVRNLEVPPGWQVGQISSGATPLSRVTLCGHRTEGGWEGCETLSMFRFTGTPQEGLLQENADRTLRDLNADSVTTFSLSVTAEPFASAARSSGYFSAAGRRIWAQYSTYIGTEGSGEGFLIEHAIYADATHRVLLRNDISDIGDAVLAGFMEQVDTVNTKDHSRPPQP